MTRRQRLHLEIHGRVQGVGFRYFVQAIAAGLGLTGEVCNLADGSVEVVAEGERPALEALAAAARRGPGGARGTDVTESWSEASGHPRGFRVTHERRS